MKQNFFNSSKKTIQSILFILLLVMLTVAFVFCIIWPLWFVSTNFPNVYTIIALSLVAIFIIIFTIKKIKKYLVSESEVQKSHKIKKLIFSMLGILILLTGLMLFVKNILNYEKLWAFILLFTHIVLSSILFSISKKANVENN